MINSQLKQGKSRKRVVQYQNHIVTNSNVIAVIVNFGLESSVFVLVKKNKGDKLNHSKKFKELHHLPFTRS